MRNKLSGQHLILPQLHCGLQHGWRAGLIRLLPLSGSPRPTLPQAERFTFTCCYIGQQPGPLHCSLDQACFLPALLSPRLPTRVWLQSICAYSSCKTPSLPLTLKSTFHLCIFCNNKNLPQLCISFRGGGRWLLKGRCHNQKPLGGNYSPPPQAASSNGQGSLKDQAHFFAPALNECSQEAAEQANQPGGATDFSTAQVALVFKQLYLSLGLLRVTLETGLTGRNLHRTTKRVHPPCLG